MHTMRAHELKTWPEPFRDMERGVKTFEYRSERDRRFEVGDLLRLDEWDPNTGSYTQRHLVCQVTYVLRGPLFGIPEGYVVMSVIPPGERMQEIAAGCTCTPATGRQDDCPVHANGGQS